MASFTVPYSSSPPSTPGAKFGNNNGTSFGSFAPNPSTTPAGPPPSSVASFTPAGPPPSSIFGSSQLQSGNNTFANAPSFQKWEQPKFGGLGSSKQSASTQPLYPGAGGGTTKWGAQPTFDQSSNSLAQSPLPGMEEDEYSEEGDEDAEFEDDDDMDVDAGYEEQSRPPQPFATSLGAQPAFNRGSLINASPGQTYNALRSSKRARAKGHNQRRLRIGESKSPRKPKDSAVSEIARSLAARRENATIDEPDDLILVTEDLISKVYAELEGKDRHSAGAQTALSYATEDLIENWQSHVNAEDTSDADETVSAIGPSEVASPLTKATFLSTLLLNLHHPFEVQDTKDFASKSRSRQGDSASSKTRPATVPEVILDWLDSAHDSVQGATDALLAFKPNPAAHPSYWDIILTFIIRGHLQDALKVFEKSDFQYARSSIDDGEPHDGYHGHQLQVVDKVLKRTRQILLSCPGVRNGNWDIKGREWGAFRRQVEAGLEELIIIAEGPEQPTEDVAPNFQAENFGISGMSSEQSNALSISQYARRTSSKVPWTIYQSLKDLYGVLLGSASEILSYSQDWAEATMALTLWWDGDDDDEIAFEESVPRTRSLRQSHSQAPRSVDVNTGIAYIRRLGYAFERVTEGSQESNFQIDSMNAVEVGLAAIFENDVEAVLGLLQSWSLPLAAAVAEIATLGGWLEASTGTDLMGEFNESDLIVLGSQGNAKKITKNSILDIYSTGLFMKGTLIGDGDPASEREGWELAFEIIPRLNDRSQVEHKVNDFLNEFPLESQEMADKLMCALEGLGLDQAAQRASEMYSDYIAETSQSYGTALIGYARAHNHKKIKNVLDLLMSYCLVQSTAYPAVSDLDEHLLDLLQHPKVALKSVFDADTQSGEMLRYYLSGYATLRKFYDLRDEEISAEKGSQPKHQPLARRRLAAEALLAVINSATDSIHGGLYDKSRESVVQVDGLMVLLGEALFFVNQPKRALTDDQIFGLLKAIEDLQTVTTRVYDQCEEFFQSAIRNSRGTEPPSLQSMFKKTQSNLSASIFSFSMIGSQMLESGPPSRSMGSSGVLVSGNIKRGWDWRSGLPREVKGAEVLRELRLGLAKQLAMA